jgi:hypothetical protein
VRILGAVGLLALTSCASSSTPAATPPVEAKVVARYSLTAAGGTIGTITSIVRCGSRLYLGDVETRIHRIDLSTGRVETPLEDGSILPMALASDCERNRIWAISPLPRGGGLRAVAFDLGSGKRAGELAIPVPCFATSAVVSADELFVGGECIEGTVGDGYVVPEAAAYYSDKRIGVRLSLASGERRGGAVPFESSCHGGGACVGGSIARFGGGWLASLPVASRIGVYSHNGDLTGTISVASPGFVTHYLLDVPPGWSMNAPQRPQFKAGINVLTGDGTPLHVDVPLPELPVGADDEALYVVDYGAEGRQGAHESVTVLRVTVPVS